MVVVAYQTLRLQLMDKSIYFIQVPVNFRCSVGGAFRCCLVPITIKPDASNFSIIGKQLGKLVFHELNIIIPVAFYSTACALAGAPCPPAIIITAPIKQGVIEEQFNALLVALVCYHLYDILFIRSMH